MNIQSICTNMQQMIDRAEIILALNRALEIVLKRSIALEKRIKASTELNGIDSDARIRLSSMEQKLTLMIGDAENLYRESAIRILRPEIPKYFSSKPKGDSQDD